MLMNIIKPTPAAFIRFTSDTSWKERSTALEAFLEEQQEKISRLAAVGECGLDFSAACSVPHDVQEEVFSTQLKLARKYGLPLSLHGREAMDIVLYIRRLPRSSASFML